MKSKKKPKTISELNQIYEKANEIDSSLFSEQRSNILLAAGEHYTKKNSQFWSRMRDTVQLNEEQKLRLTKNHTHRIVNTYIDNIFSLAPGVTVLPNNEKERQDQKTAELNQSVWNYWKKEVDYREQVRSDVEDFVKIGEVAGKIYFEPNAGEVIGHEQAITEDGQPATDEWGNPLPDEEKPVFSGKICYERIYGFNLLREPTSKDSMTEGITIIRKMVPVNLLKKIYENDDEKLSYIQPTQNDTFVVFDTQKGSYSNAKDEVMIREFYVPKSYENQKGYYYITTQLGILEEGELPFGVFPIIFTGFDSIPTTPRKRSIIKVLRPFQAEINRAASKLAETQITLGDDKLLVMAGSKVTQSAKLPGVRVLNYTGMAPTILAGRSGEQYLGYMQSQIAEMYQAARVEELGQEKISQSPDSIAELLKVARQKQKYSFYAEKIENYQVKKAEKVLELAKHYYPDEILIPAIGKAEVINISEFRNTEPSCYRISLEASNDDYETKFGKYLQFNTILQYVGQKLEREDLGGILRAMPYMNNQKIFSNLTLDEDISENMMLALERGEMPRITIDDPHKFLIKKLGKRRTEADFPLLPLQIQQNYETVLNQLREQEAMFMQKMKEAQSELIPATGPLVKVELYVDDPENPGKTAKAKMPTDSLVWLKKQLESQGIQLEQLAKIQEGQVAEMATQFLDRVGQDYQSPFPPNY